MRKMGIGLGVGINRSNYAQGIFDAYNARVVADGGITEAGNCVNAVSGLLQTASLLLIPSGYKSGKAYAEIPTNGNGDLTWTRASDAWRTNADGLIQRVPWNLLQYSEEFNNGYWYKNGTSVSANTTTAPNGTTTADSWIETNINGYHVLGKSLLALNSGSYVITIYAKAKERSKFLIFYTGTPNKGYGFDLANGTTSAVTGITSADSYSITSVEDGWYRCQIGVSASTIGTVELTMLTSFTSLPYQGDGTSGLYLWGAQLVEGSSAQTYFPTTDRLNVPRLSYMYGSCPALLLEPQRTNSIRNSICSGAATGTPGTYPTNWSATSTGLTQSVVAIGTENGLAYVDLRFNGTANTTLARITPEGPTVISATNSQSWAMSTYAKLISGSYDSSALGFIMRSSVGSNLGLLSQTITLNSTFQRFSNSATTNQASTAFVQPFIDFYVTSGQTYDFTIRIAQPQIELGAYSTTPILTTGSASATRIADSFSRNNIYTNGLITSSGGTWFVELKGNVAYTRDSASGLEIANAGFTQRIIIFNAGGSSRLIVFLTTAGTVYTTTTDTVKLAIKWNGSNASVFANGTKVANNVTFTGLSMENLIGGQGVPFFIQAMALYPSPLSDTDCTTLTTL